MISTIFWTVFTIALFGYVAWSKYKKHRKQKEQREGRDPSEGIKSTEELRQDESKHRKPNGGFGGF